jgi:hypothetical protein
MRAFGAAVSILLLTACGLDIIPPAPPDRTEQVRVPWLLYGGAGNELELGALTMGADCQRFAGVDVIESDQNVEVRAWVEALPSDKCGLVLRIAPASVRLDAPLGPRALTGCMIDESGSYSTRVDCAQLVDPET